jgi:MYXO-CTERM domain-containing protein
VSGSLILPPLPRYADIGLSFDSFRLTRAGIAIVGVLVAAQARADIYVDAAAPAGGDGQLATPFRTLHEAYAVVADNTAQVIRVAAGNYVDNVGSSTDLSNKNRKYTFLGGYQSGSGFATRDPATYVTTATAADVTKPVFWFFNTSAVTIDGFTITNGKSGVLIEGWSSNRTSAVTHCHVYGNGHGSTNSALNNGGGLSISSLSVTVSDNVIENNNSAAFGGGVYVGKLDGEPAATATIERNAIKNNTAHGGQAHGGGVFLATNGIVRDNLIDGNAIDNSGAAGGGLIVLGTGVQATIERNWVSRNVSVTGGGGIIIDEAATATLINNVIVRNKSGRSGSGVDVDQGSTPSHATLVNNTIAFNMGPPGVQVHNSTVDMINTIVWGHSAGDLDVDSTAGGTLNVSYSGFSSHSTGVTLGAGNLQDDPEFINATSDDYRLSAQSPLNDHGAASRAPVADYSQNPRPQGAGVDIGAYEQTDAGASNGNPWPTSPDAGGSGGTMMGTGGSSGTTGAGGSSGTTGAAGSVAAGGVSGGCGCSIEGRGPTALGPILLGLVGLRRRRRFRL